MPTWPRPLKKTRSPGGGASGRRRRRRRTAPRPCVVGDADPGEDVVGEAGAVEACAWGLAAPRTGSQVLHGDADDAAVLRGRNRPPPPPPPVDCVSRRASAAASRRAWRRARRPHLGDLILDRGQQLLALSQRRLDLLRLAARSATTCSCLLRACSSSASRCLISSRNLRTSSRICASWSLTRLPCRSRRGSRRGSRSRAGSRRGRGCRSGRAGRAGLPASPGRCRGSPARSSVASR